MAEDARAACLMYGSSEDRYARRRLGDFVRELEAVYEEGIPSLMTTKPLQRSTPLTGSFRRGRR